MVDTPSAMDLIPIESDTRTIQTCFQQCLYEVPNFQRPYSWTEDELDDFWNDVVLARGDFFFGSTVTWVSKKRELFNDTYSIIDGQQRLTTSAIILSVIRDAFALLAEESASSDAEVGKASTNQSVVTQRYLIAEDDDGERYRVLTRPEPMFYECVQNPSAIPSGVSWNHSAKQIGVARAYFERKVTSELESIDFQKRLERLKEIRSNVLRARVIQIELASEEDGFLIFETLNTRGAELRLSDLVKNLLVRGGASNSVDRDSIAGRWERLIELIQQERTGPDVADRFIWQSWNSRRNAVREPELFKQVSKLVSGSPASHISYLEELEADSVTYARLDNQLIKPVPKKQGTSTAFAVPEFVDAVRALAIFNVSVANSAILALVRKYESKKMSEAQLVSAAKHIEAFHFQFSALTTSSSTGGTRSRYNVFATRLEGAKNKQEIGEAIADLRTKLQASLPEVGAVINQFTRLFYAPKLRLNQSQKRRSNQAFIAYVLMSFAKFHKLLPAGQDLASWSIEHIAPQSGASQDPKDSVYSIGNLTLLTSGLNAEIGDGDLPSKAKALRDGCCYFDPELENWIKQKYSAPSKEQIQDRSKSLAKEAINSVWGL